jgi:hypothetical protein
MPFKLDLIKNIPATLGSRDKRTPRNRFLAEDQCLRCRSGVFSHPANSLHSVERRMHASAYFTPLALTITMPVLVNNRVFRTAFSTDLVVSTVSSRLIETLSLIPDKSPSLCPFLLKIRPNFVVPLRMSWILLCMTLTLFWVRIGIVSHPRRSPV